MSTTAPVMSAIRCFSCGSNSAGGCPCKTRNATPALVDGATAIELSSLCKVKFVDGSWHMNKARIPREEFLVEHIPGAQLMDIDVVADTSSGLPHMLPSAEVFRNAVESLGISSDDHVVVYTTKDCFSAARVWWMFKVFGHHRVSVLNGGLRAWKDNNGPVESGPPRAVPRGSFNVKYNPKCVVDSKEVLKVVETGMAQIVDARSKARFYAEVPEPRPGLEGGHIPGSLCLPFTTIVKDDDYTTFKSPEEIRDAFVDNGVIFGARTILSCGSGVSAAVLAMGLQIIGKDVQNSPIYDGSWTEWGANPALPKSKL